MTADKFSCLVQWELYSFTIKSGEEIYFADYKAKKQKPGMVVCVCTHKVEARR